jgi:hypothetical protein
MMAAWTVATVPPPRIFPMTRAVRPIGATSISRRKPNSRSHTIDTAEKMAVNRTVMARMPGNMNVRKSKPAPPGISLASPVPRTNRNRIGCTREVTIRILLRKKRIISRRQTTAIPRRSCCRVSPTVAGTVTVTSARAIASLPTVAGGIGCDR